MTTRTVPNKPLISKYLRILCIKPKDLRADVNFLAGYCARKRKSYELTNYVYRENKVLYTTYLYSIEAFGKFLCTNDT